MRKALRSFLIVGIAALSCPTFAVQKLILPKDHYVDRLNFVKDAISVCQKLISGEWKLERRGKLTEAQLKFLNQMTNSEIISASVIGGGNEAGIGSLSATLAKTGNKASYFTIDFDDEHFKFELQHDEYVSEGIAKILLSPRCDLNRATLSFFDRNEVLVLRQWLNEKYQIAREITTKEPVKDFEKITSQSKNELQSQQRQFKVTVGIIDQGVDYNHPKLAAKMRPNQETLQTLNNLKKDLETSKLSAKDRARIEKLNPEWLKTSDANRRKIQQEIKERSENENRVGRDFMTNDFFAF